MPLLTYHGRPVDVARVVDAVTSRAHYYVVQPFVGAVPRALWANDAGIRGNLRGQKLLAASRRAWATRHGAPPPETAESKRLREQGWVALDGGSPVSAVARIRSSYARLIADDRGSTWSGVGRYREASRHILDAAKNLEGIEELLTPRLRAAVEGYYGGHFDVMHVRAWRTRPVEALDDQADAYSNQWHSDRFPTSWLRVFVYLSDGVAKSTGAFRLHPLASSREIIRTGHYLRRTLILPRARRLLEDESRVVYFEGDAGATCLANVQLCLHRAGVPRAGYERDMLQLTLRPATKPLADDWVRHLPADRLAD